MSNVRFIGLDVHAETIAVAVAEPNGEVRSLGVIPNRPESIRKLVKKLGEYKEQLEKSVAAKSAGHSPISGRKKTTSNAPVRINRAICVT